eukprot:2490008-Rhodomonas_salina.2
MDEARASNRIAEMMLQEVEAKQGEEGCETLQRLKSASTSNAPGLVRSPLCLPLILVSSASTVAAAHACLFGSLVLPLMRVSSASTDAGGRAPRV